jgi:glycine betaine/choline ABC-type transport system substrate-binding protein
VLTDDKHAFPPYQACYIVRENALTKFAGLREALDELNGSLTDATMRELNRKVDLEHVSVTRVAADFLAKLGQGRR